jgi:hypothetical protein
LGETPSRRRSIGLAGSFGWVPTTLHANVALSSKKVECKADQPAVAMGAPDVMFNPAKGVKVKCPNSSLVPQTMEQQAEGEKCGGYGED